MIGKNDAFCDALATASFLTGPEKAAEILAAADPEASLYYVLSDGILRDFGGLPYEEK